VNWLLAGALEVLFWLVLVLALLARYWWRRPRLARWLFAYLVVDTLGFLILGLYVLVVTRRADVFEIVVLAALLWTLVYWREEVRRVDRWLCWELDDYERTRPPHSQRSLTRFLVHAARHPRFRGADPERDSQPPGSSDLVHARRERTGWFRHLVLFVPGQLALWIGAQVLGGPDAALLTRLAGVWAVVFVVDTIWSWSYTLWPRRVPEQGALRGNGSIGAGS
jgi:hypothetical protein